MRCYWSHWKSLCPDLETKHGFGKSCGDRGSRTDQRRRTGKATVATTTNGRHRQYSAPPVILEMQPAIGLAGRQPHKRVGAYELYDCIGQGSFASVYRGQHRDTRQVVAVKAIVRARLNAKLQENLDAEIRILQSTQHPNVMQLHEVATTERHVYLVLEFCPGGDLMQVIRKHGAQSEEQTRLYLVQLARGLQHLRQRNLIHRDLKPQNLLLSSTSPNAVLKIGDFGFARHIQHQDLAETMCGSPLYMAPEILNFQRYDAKADLWSVGTIMYELLVGRPPYTGANHVQLLHNIKSRAPQWPTHVSAACGSLLQGLLQRDPMVRLLLRGLLLMMTSDDL